MKAIFHTKNGTTERDLTKEEIESLAVMGDSVAKQELSKIETSKASTIEERLTIVEKHLKLK